MGFSHHGRSPRQVARLFPVSPPEWSAPWRRQASRPPGDLRKRSHRASATMPDRRGPFVRVAKACVVPEKSLDYRQAEFGGAPSLMPISNQTQMFPNARSSSIHCTEPEPTKCIGKNTGVIAKNPAKFASSAFNQRADQSSAEVRPFLIANFVNPAME